MNRLRRSTSRWLVRSLVGAALLSISWINPIQVQAASVPRVFLMVDGKGLKTDVEPQIVNNRMLVPIRAVSEATKAQVTYQASTKQVVIKTKTNEFTYRVNQKTAWGNGKKHSLDVSPIVKEGRILVPLRSISELLGYQVKYNEQSKVAMVATKTSPATYTVQAGDSLWSISQKFGVPISAIQNASRLTKEEIRQGMTLTIPVISMYNQTWKPLDIQSKQQYLGNIDQALAPKQSVFPLQKGTWYEQVYNTYGDERTWGADTQGRNHEGIDIMAFHGVPVFSSTNGVINRLGWNSMGGWRVNITHSSGKYRVYYAHLSAFAPEIKVGSPVKAGQLIGFVGDTGYGPMETTGMFSPHLHFGLYSNQTGKAVNPYFFLKYLETIEIQSTK
ncbi:LysM peptidoglycan-binding domain-containing protein [Brevibacillus laterosporus]|uniref:L-Ala--D-Glu endopeptidase n=1 Tax=Brevibacillus laterosporus LMG 15441 TaxID=1042163 RepID=A0A075R8C3_BRELA|nr:stalk domain-containing protein [Brevibacillus laterosporus]AIG27538.1 L-Ala--D-Glu endopeptidase precursor [Brevibacillus laterosporus LMG 15441]RJL15443.1 LysM peptidoglycan-binding domain-containing protein [Brevibacillus laterosporus]TPH06393.1 LysM peptidoglycan-binding domain-containing protein [Brevibacillus laterosporus]